MVCFLFRVSVVGHDSKTDLDIEIGQRARMRVESLNVKELRRWIKGCWWMEMKAVQMVLDFNDVQPTSDCPSCGSSTRCHAALRSRFHWKNFIAFKHKNFLLTMDFLLSFSSFRKCR